MAAIKLRGVAAWGPPASPDRLDFPGKEGGLTGDRRGRTPAPHHLITRMETLPLNSEMLTSAAGPDIFPKLDFYDDGAAGYEVPISADAARRVLFSAQAHGCGQ